MDSRQSDKKRRSSRGKKNKIFISWSGKNSKDFAICLKRIIETQIFPGTDLECFVSDLNIVSGTDWWTKIKGELKSCRLGIFCITKENINAPWIYYEAGALAAREVPTIPLLIGCNTRSLSGSPLQGKQCVSFDNQSKFIKMIEDINTLFDNPLPQQLIPKIAEDAYHQLKTESSATLKHLKSLRIIDGKDTYPQNITEAKKDTVYLSVPMASISDEDLAQLHEYLLSLVPILKKIGFTEIYSSALTIDNKDAFDGKTKAMDDNFTTLKQIDSILVIYPWKKPSSTLVDIGYGIALCKKIVIFYKEGLPYILEEAGEHINHVRTYTFEDYSEISKILSSNGMTIFEGGNDA